MIYWEEGRNDNVQSATIKSCFDLTMKIFFKAWQWKLITSCIECWRLLREAWHVINLFGLIQRTLN